MLSRFTAMFIFISATLNASAMPLEYGDIYSSNYFSHRINHYDSNGAYIDSFLFPTSSGSDVRGIAFGTNGLLYAVSTTSAGFGVSTIDNDGAITFVGGGSSYIKGNVSYGKIAVANDGRYYVAGENNLTAFAPGSTTGTVIYTANQVYDVEVLPSGNLLVLSAYSLQEITSSGAVVRNINPSIELGDARGLEYDPATDSIYVTMLGDIGKKFNFRLMRIDGDTGVVEVNENFWYGDDLFLTLDGELLVGSRTQAPGIFDTDLNKIGSLQHGFQMFVTQMV